MRRVSRRALLQAGGAVAFTGCATSPPHTPAPSSIDALELVAEDLARPEGIVAFANGSLAVSCHDAAVSILTPNGARRDIGRAHSANGICADGRGGIVVANFGLLGDVPGSLQRVDLATGETTTLASAIEGRDLVGSNCPALGPDGDIYCTHSKWRDPYNVGNTDPSGFVYKVSRAGVVSRVVDGIRGANGICFGANFETLYVAQTAAGDVQRFTRTASAGYANRTQHGPRLGLAPDNLDAVAVRTMPAAERTNLGLTDGLAMDAAGNLWGTLPFAGKLVAITPAGEAVEILSDAAGEKLNMPTNIAFGGPDLRDLYIASMRNNKVWRLRVQTAGLALPHWRA
ncbi:gluconolactonase [alpha proteobacterium U9-1i]|nr:gluconolactonase [alpha proteobacterium U9-1i]